LNATTKQSNVLYNTASTISTAQPAAPFMFDTLIEKKRLLVAESIHDHAIQDTLRHDYQKPVIYFTLIDASSNDNDSSEHNVTFQVCNALHQKYIQSQAFHFQLPHAVLLLVEPEYQDLYALQMYDKHSMQAYHYPYMHTLRCALNIGMSDKEVNTLITAVKPKKVIQLYRHQHEYVEIAESRCDVEMDVALIKSLNGDDQETQHAMLRCVLDIIDGGKKYQLRELSKEEEEAIISLSASTQL
jgi:hypothetical protein